MDIKFYSTNFPKLNKKKILKTDTFLTSTVTDDFYFAKAQLSQIDDNIHFKEGNKLKPWERINNNIYYKTGQSNRQKISLIKKNNKIKDSFNINWKDQHYYTQTEIGKINESKNISKQMKTLSKLKIQYKKNHIDLDTFIPDNKKIFLNKILINLMKKEQKKIYKKENSYNKALKKAHTHLITDIHEFDKYISAQNTERKNHFNELNKIIQINKHLEYEYKKRAIEYSSLFNEIKKYLKLLFNIKYYSKFIHHILGGESEILKCTELDTIDFKNLSENDIKRALTQIKKIFNVDKELNNIKCNIQKEILDDQFKLDTLYQILERNIINLLNKKNLHDQETCQIQEEGKISIDEENLKINNLQNEYLMYLKEYELEIKDFKKISFDPSEEKYIKFVCKLLREIKNYIKQAKGIKEENSENDDNSIFTGVAIPIINYIQKKEDKINELLVQMEKCHKEDPELFHKMIINRKNYNRRMKYLNERKLLEMKQIMRNKNIVEKLNKVIIKEKYRYKVPPPAKPHKSVKKKNNEDENDNISDFIEY